MSRSTGALLALLALLVLGSSGGIATAVTTQPAIRQQVPCKDGANSYCLEFQNTDPFPSQVRLFQFSVPGPGKASVSFDGSIFCTAFGDDKVMDFYGQIVTSAGAAAQGFGPGGWRYVAQLNAFQSESMNMAATRVISYAAGGTKIVYFKLNKLRQDASQCFIYNAAFSVVFVP
jgi:hypothetical protein